MVLKSAVVMVGDQIFFSKVSAIHGDHFMCNKNYIVGVGARVIEVTESFKELNNKKRNCTKKMMFITKIIAISN